MDKRKAELLAVINNAKLSHQRWLDNAIALVEGKPLDKHQVPVNVKECELGHWYYGEGQLLKPMSVFRELGIYHEALHNSYHEIFQLLFGEVQTKPSMINRLFGTAHKLSQEKQVMARARLMALEQHSTAIIKKLNELESFVKAMAPQQIDSFLGKDKT